VEFGGLNDFDRDLIELQCDIMTRELFADSFVNHGVLSANGL
jgi:hypothetical protein